MLVGTRLDLEDTPGIDDSDFVLRVDASYAFNPRHELRLGVLDLDRTAAPRRERPWTSG